MLSTDLTTDAPETLLYTCQVHDGRGNMLSSLALVADVAASTYEVQHPTSLRWLVVPASHVVLGGRLDLAQPDGDPFDRQAWEYHQADGWTYHPAPAAMPASPQQARQVALAQASAKYPNETARIERGYLLALAGAVTLLPGGATVHSQTTDDTYTVRKGTCDCVDFPRAPEGRCKHRWAVAFAKRAAR